MKTIDSFLSERLCTDNAKGFVAVLIKELDRETLRAAKISKDVKSTRNSFCLKSEHAN